MATKASQLKEQIAALKGGAQVKNDKNEKTPYGGTPNPKAKSGKGYIPKGTGAGGRMPGAGRKPLEHDEERRTLKRSYEEFAKEEVEMPVTRLEKGTKVQRIEKMKRVRVVQEKLFKKVQEGDVQAIKEFNDRVLGKSRQTIVGDEDEAPVQIDLGVGRILDKAYGIDPDTDESD